MLASRLGSFEELRVADLFAGSGALGLEALSRGAASATFVEKDSAAVAIIRRNAVKLGAAERIQVIGGSALSLPKSSPFDLILADPPYVPGSGAETLKSVLDAGWAVPGCWIAIETQRGDFVEPPLDVVCEVERDVGRARLTLLRYS
jgi:16S rRNA (guanine966-N2)-methyltransferase